MAPAENGKTILLAENEQTVRTFVLAMLQNSGYHVITAVDGQDALEKARQFDGTIHLLLSDVQMPKMTGIELATQIQVERPDTRVLLMSGMATGMLLLNDGWQFLATQIQVERPETRVLLMSGMATRMLLLNDGWQFVPKPFMHNILKERVHGILLEQPQDGRQA